MPFSFLGGVAREQVTIQVAPLFLQENQKDPSINWQGDWIFRRKRLDLLDQQLATSKPDVIVFQDLIYRAYSPSESEQNLLSAGSLANYSWHVAKTGYLESSEETIASGVAAALPSRIDFAKTMSSKEVWEIEGGAKVVYTQVKTENGSIALLSVNAFGASGKLSYASLQEVFSEISMLSAVCPERIVLTGDLPQDRVYGLDEEFMRSNALKDAAVGFCDEVDLCYTESRQNPVARLLGGLVNSDRNIRVLLHSDVKVISSGRNLDKKSTVDTEVKFYGLDAYTVSDKYGWLVVASFPICKS